MPNLTRNFYLVESELNNFDNKKSNQINDLEYFNSYINNRRAMKNQWHDYKKNNFFNEQVKTKINYSNYTK